LLIVGGCDFGADPRLGYRDQPVVWTAEALPTVLDVRPSDPGVAAFPLDAKPLLRAVTTLAGDDTAERYGVIPSEAGDHRVRLSGAVTAEIAVVLPLDHFFDHRAAAALRLWRALKGLKAGPDAMPLTHYARRQLILVLRALDGVRDGADERDIAAALFNVRTANRRAWLASEHYARLRRLLARGRTLLNGGYRQILRPAPRRPRRK